MKKYDLLKVLGITFAVVLLLSWIIPAGVYSSSTYTAFGSTAPIGLYDVFRTVPITIATFIQYGLLFLAIGAFYGVLNKTGVYSKIVDEVVKRWSKKQNQFLLLTIVFFALLTSVIGLVNVIFILVPFFVAILLKLGFNKITTFASTVGSMLVSQIGCTFGFSIWGYLKIIFGLEMNTLILARIILFVMLMILFAMLVRKQNEKTKKEEDIPLYVKEENKKEVIPLIVMCILTFILLVVGSYNWYYAFEFDFFKNLSENIMSYEFNGYPLFSNLLGTVSEVGNFGNYDIVVILLISSFLIGWIYSVKFDEIIKGLKEGAKEMLLPATYAMIASVVFAALINLSGGNFISTIVNKFIGDGKEFTFMGTIGSALITSIAYNDYYTLLANFYGAFSAYETTIIPIVAFIFQTVYGIVMVIAPTSLYLLAGLSYLKIPYKDWVKYIWKFLLLVFGIVVVVAFVLTTL